MEIPNLDKSVLFILNSHELWYFLVSKRTMSADEIFNSCVLFEDDFVLEEISPDLDP